MQQGPINQTVQGFLGLLGLKTQGRNVQTVDDAMLPIIDYMPWLIAQSEDVNIGSLAVNSTGAQLASATNAVPANEMWVISAYTLSTPALLAADDIGGYPIIAPPTSAGPYYICGPYLRSPPGTAGRLYYNASAYNLFQPIIMLPGMRFGMVVTDYTSVGAINVGVQFRRLRISA